ncbi:stalk domain-containing protein [Paenibacillus sp. BC26]|uniref:stalk domain-containing protein n=1 Tax=Paenibacillus sp. BC26 TaxID=1881032 RepID=UPI0008F36DA8|nr:stalk domain-containing protein [Paenibacillus sp. BC26]SFS76466.1 NPCBM/NEW2 domain-containing protein [Paenibacillus sp. BC26]
MSKIKNMKLITGGFIAGAVFFSGVSYAASNSMKIEAFFGVKLIQNGIDKTPTENKPFIYNGSTYVPLRTASDLLGVPVSWDSKNSSVIIGQKVSGSPLGTPDNVSTVDPGYLGISSPSIKSNQSMTVNSKQYGNSGFTLISIQSTGMPKAAVLMKYTLNNQYKKLNLALGIDDNSRDESDDVLRNITFKDQDGITLKQVSLGIGTVKENIEIDLKGVLVMTIEVDGNNMSNLTSKLDFINPLLGK